MEYYKLHIQEIPLQENYSKEKLIQNSFTKILQKEDGIRAYYPKSSSRMDSHPTRTPKRVKNNQQQQQQPVKEVNKEE